MGSWGYFTYPTEPASRDDWVRDEEIRVMEEREAEWEARPTYEELMEMDDGAVEEE